MSPEEAGLAFVERTRASGIDFVRENGPSAEFYLAESFCAGAAFFDAEGDGDQDLYLLNGRDLTRPIDADTPANAFYRNDGLGRFEDESAATGLGDRRYSCGVAAGDVDNDGDVDLYVTNFDGENALFRSQDGLRYEDVAREAGVEGSPRFESSCAFVDIDADGWLDLYVTIYTSTTMEDNPVCRMARRNGGDLIRRYCVPDELDPVPDLLYHNLGDGRFEDVSESSGIASVLGRSLGVACGDYDDDGDQDLFVACDRTPNLLFENRGTGFFVERGFAAGVSHDPGGRPRGGMGTTSADFDGDGHLDVAVTYFEREQNGFYRNLGDQSFTDRGDANGAGPPSYDLVGWGIEFFDIDFDGDLDALLVNGHLIENVSDFREPISSYGQRNLLLRNDGGGLFVSVGAGAGPGLALEHVSRGLATADVDGDGDVDALVCNLFGPPDLLINETPRKGRHWLGVRLVGSTSNRDAIGARIVVETEDGTQLREVRSGQSYESQSELVARFGLGSRERVRRVGVRWPSGKQSLLEDVPADQVLEIVEP